jgi:hypothetical protein
MSWDLPRRLLSLSLEGRTTDPPPSEWEVEQAVRDRLYGERPKFITVEPVVAESRAGLRPATAGSRSVR